mgnify:CR=1 FL=1
MFNSSTDYYESGLTTRAGQVNNRVCTETIYSEFADTIYIADTSKVSERKHRHVHAANFIFTALQSKQLKTFSPATKLSTVRKRTTVLVVYNKTLNVVLLARRRLKAWQQINSLRAAIRPVKHGLEHRAYRQYIQRSPGQLRLKSWQYIPQIGVGGKEYLLRKTASSAAVSTLTTAASTIITRLTEHQHPDSVLASTSKPSTTTPTSIGGNPRA